MMPQQPVGKNTDPSATSTLPRSQLNGFVKRHRMMALPMAKSRNFSSGSMATVSSAVATAVLPEIPPSGSRPSSGKQPGPKKETEVKTLKLQLEQTQESQAAKAAEEEVAYPVKEAASLNTTSDADESPSSPTDETAEKKPKKIKTEDEWKLACDRLVVKNTKLFQKTLTLQQKKTDESAKYTLDFKNHMSKICNTYFGFKSFPLKFKLIGRAETADAFLKAGLAFAFSDLVAHEISTGEFASAVDASLAQNHYLVLRRAISTIVNYTDCSNEVTFVVCNHESLLVVMLQQVSDWFPRHKAGELSANEATLLRMFLSVLHNLSMRDDNVERFRSLDAVRVLCLYLESPKEPLKLAAFATLADIVSEEEADKLATTPHLVKFLLGRLSKALDSEDHRCFGWSVTELVRAVRRLARNDANNRLLVEHGAVPLLNKGVRSTFDSEKCACMEALWVLSFEKQNTEDIMNNEELLDFVISVVRDPYQPGSFRQSCHGFLFQMREGLSQTDKYKEIGEKYMNKRHATHKASPAVEGRGGAAEKKVDEGEEPHIMLSYQWANQAIVKEIRDILRSKGYKVWMDIDDMGGSTLQAMAEAVENSFVVIICMSQKYKDSPNTRAEGEYAFQKRKPIIPLIMQKGYRPDGWLGMILGAKLFYDFSGKYSFESRIEQLIKAVQEKAESMKVKPDAVDAANVPKAQVATAAAPVFTAPPPPPPPPTGIAAKVKDWTGQDVKKWLTEFGLDGTELEHLTGKEIFFLYNLRNEAPEFFYNTLERKLHITTLTGYISFTDALSGLPST